MVYKHVQSIESIPTQRREHARKFYFVMNGFFMELDLLERRLLGAENTNRILAFNETVLPFNAKQWFSMYIEAIDKPDRCHNIDYTISTPVYSSRI